VEDGIRLDELNQFLLRVSHTITLWHTGAS
jgi:hypothetical protein